MRSCRALLEFGYMVISKNTTYIIINYIFSWLPIFIFIFRDRCGYSWICLHNRSSRPPLSYLVWPRQPNSESCGIHFLVIYWIFHKKLAPSNDCFYSHSAHFCLLFLLAFTYIKCLAFCKGFLENFNTIKNSPCKALR